MDTLNGKKVALIGGAGFIGHNLALHLAEHGATVEIIDSLQVNNLVMFASGNRTTPKARLNLDILQQRLNLLHDAGVNVHPQDARDYHALSKVLSDVEPDTVIHLAAVAHANRSNKDPYSTFDHSFRTLENSLDWARGWTKSRGVSPHFIYFSSSMIYGDFKQDPITEEAVPHPLGIYGALKLSGEHIVKAYNQVFDLPYTIVRPSALYGPRCVSGRVTQLFIENALWGHPLKIMGDGSDRLDFTYVGDLVEAVRLILLNPESRNETFNLTYGEGRSLMDLVTILQDHFANLETVYEERDRLVPRRGSLGIEKARRLLGYEPQYPLEKGYPEYIKWYRDALGLHERVEAIR